MKSESKKNQPKVSVIIPTYNRAHLLGRAIKSVLNQTYQDFEIIVVDDGSTDNTREIIKNFSENRIRYYCHKRNKGYPEALNTGLSLTRGKFIAFQDDDDEWFPEKLYRQMMIFNKAEQKIGVVYSGFWKIRNDKKIYVPSSHVVQKEGNIHTELLKGNFIGMPTSIVRRECFDKVGMFDTAISCLQDWELWIRISKYYEFKYIPEPLMISYYTQGSVNEKSILEDIRVLDFIIKKHYEDFNKNKKILSRYYYSIGINLCSIGYLSQGKKYFIKAIKTYPIDIRCSLIFIISVFGQKALSTVVKVYRKFKKLYIKIFNN
jgi:glycosyltransferase involved in cell wall biosynthesis